MGVFGTGLFSDDLALDIRACFRARVADGLEGPKATDSLLSQWADALDDVESRSVFWIALAATQVACGRLEERVKNEALQIISQGSDLQRWEQQPGLVAKRRAALDRLRTRLEGPHRKPTRIPKPFRANCAWEVDEIIAFRLRSGKFVALRVNGHHVDQGGTRPICELFDWAGTALPSAADLNSADVRRGISPRDQITFMMVQRRKSDLPAERLYRLGFEVPFSQNPSGGRGIRPKGIEDLLNPAFGIGCILWKSLDQELETVFGLA